jgi:hypothetical protein
MALESAKAAIRSVLAGMIDQKAVPQEIEQQLVLDDEHGHYLLLQRFPGL